MTSRDFCYWLQGYFEIGGFNHSEFTAEQVVIIRNHLAMVFKHEIDPSFKDKEELQKIHNKQIIRCDPEDKLVCEAEDRVAQKFEQQGCAHSLSDLKLLC